VRQLRGPFLETHFNQQTNGAAEVNAVNNNPFLLTPR
jgi:hypothetical protein